MYKKIDKFFHHNNDFYSKRKNDRGNSNKILFVNASYKDKFIVTSTMKIASAVAETLNQRIAVLPHFNADKLLIWIIKSFVPFEIIDVRHILLKGFLINFFKILKLVVHINTGHDLSKVTISNMHIGPYIYDTILKRMHSSTIDKITYKQKILIFFELAYFHSMLNYFDTKEVSFAIVPDNTYRDGLIYEIIKSKQIKCIVGIDFNGISMHKYDTLTDFNQHCRVPDLDLVDLVHIKSDLNSNVAEYIDRRFSGKVMQHDIIRAYSQNKRSIDRKSLIKEYHLDPDKKIIIVMAHVFCDAPHACPNMLFQDYEKWLIQTCQHLANNYNVNYLVKEHPSVELYGEAGKALRILEDNGFENKMLSSDINTSSLFNCVDVIVTCGGTAGMEFPCFGIPVLLGARAPYSSFSYAISPDNTADYFEEISKIHTYDRLSDSDKRKAEAVLYVIQSVMQVGKGEIGLGSQDFYQGSGFNYDVFMDEMIEDCIYGNGFSALCQAMRVFLMGQHKNFIDYKKLNIQSDNK